MKLNELLRRLVEGLEADGVVYAIGGSVASMVYGEPRSTLDIDVVVTLDPASASALRSRFPAPEFYLSPERVSEAIREGGMFNVIQPDTGFKIDFFVASDLVEERQLARRIRRPLFRGLDAWFSPPEELIVKKLQYAREGGSDKHLRDIGSMLRISSEIIDVAVVEALVSRLGLEAEWERASTTGGSGPR